MTPRADEQTVLFLESITCVTISYRGQRAKVFLEAESCDGYRLDRLNDFYKRAHTILPDGRL